MYPFLNWKNVFFLIFIGILWFRLSLFSLLIFKTTNLLPLDCDQWWKNALKKLPFILHVVTICLFDIHFYLFFARSIYRKNEEGVRDCKIHFTITQSKYKRVIKGKKQLLGCCFCSFLKYNSDDALRIFK